MTATLPTVGGSSGIWGNLLNTFLQVALKSDGRLKYIANAMDYDGASPTAKIDAALADGAETIVVVPAAMGAGDPTNVPTGKLIIDLRNAQFKLWGGTALELRTDPTSTVSYRVKGQEDLAFTPVDSTQQNVAGKVSVAPKGTGQASGPRSEFRAYYAPYPDAENVNLEAHNDGDANGRYRLVTRVAGSGIHRPFYFQIGGNNGPLITIDGVLVSGPKGGGGAWDWFITTSGYNGSIIIGRNGQALLAVTADGTGLVPLIKADASNRVLLDANGWGIYAGTGSRQITDAAGLPVVPLGASSSIGKSAGLANVQTSVAGVGNGADTTADDLFAYTLPANALSANGKGVRVRAYGATAGNGNNKRIFLSFGGVNIISIPNSAWNGPDWTAEMEVTRIDATHINAIGTILGDGQTPRVGKNINVTVPDLGTNATIIKVMGQSPTSGAANDVVGYGFKVSFEN